MEKNNINKNNKLKSILDNYNYELSNNNNLSAINNSLNQISKKILETIDNKFSDFENAKSILIRNSKEAIKNIYLESISNIETDSAYIFNITKNAIDSYKKGINNNNIIDAVYDVKRFKQKLFYLNELLTNEIYINENFTPVNNKLERKLKNINLHTIKNNKNLLLDNEGITWKIRKSLEDLNPTNEENSYRLIIPSTISSYFKCFVSIEVFDGPVTCSILLVKLSTFENINKNWFYCYGLIKADKEDESSYFYHAATIQSNTNYNIAFSGSLNSNKFGRVWKEGDIITLERDINNDVYYSMNYEYRQKIFLLLTSSSS